MVSAVIVERISIFVRFAAPRAARFAYKHSKVSPEVNTLQHFRLAWKANIHTFIHTVDTVVACGSVRDCWRRHKVNQAT